MSKTPAAALASKPKVGVKGVEVEHEEPTYARGMKPKKAAI